MPARPTATWRDSLAVRLSSPSTYVIVVSAVALLTYFGPLASLVGLFAALLTLWARRWDWGFFGLSRPHWVADLVRALKFAAVAVLLVDLLIQPAVNRAIGSGIDLSGFKFVEGSLPNLFIFLALMWTVAAFGEELFFRGYLMGGCARHFGNTGRSWLIGGLISTAIFGLVHAYQGAAGVINTSLVGAVFAFQFYRKPDRLVSCVLAHGIYNTFGLILLYLGKGDIVTRLIFG